MGALQYSVFSQTQCVSLSGELSGSAEEFRLFLCVRCWRDYELVIAVWQLPDKDYELVIPSAPHTKKETVPRAVTWKVSHGILPNNVHINTMEKTPTTDYHYLACLHCRLSLSVVFHEPCAQMCSSLTCPICIIYFPPFLVTRSESFLGWAFHHQRSYRQDLKFGA